MHLGFLLTGVLLFGIGIFMMITGYQKTKPLKRYESENTTPDGDISFDSITSSRTHTADKNLFRLIGVFGFFVGVLGLIFIGYGFVL